MFLLQTRAKQNKHFFVCFRYTQALSLEDLLDLAEKGARATSRPVLKLVSGGR